MKQLPSNWVIKPLGEVAVWGSGGTPNRNSNEYYGGNIPWFKTGELNEGILLAAEEYLTEEGIKNSSAKIFPKGSIMIAMYGATIGKCAILGVDGSTNQACAVAQPKDGLDPIYLFYYLKSQKQNFIDKGKGGAQPNISQAVIKEHPIPLAPLPEQKRIVAKLDKLFAHLDQLKARLERIPELLKQFRQAVLTQAVTGKLTEEWRGGFSFASVDEIINKLRLSRLNSAVSEAERTQVERIYKKEEKRKRFAIPSTWRLVSLDKVCYSFSYGSSSKSDDTGEIPVLRMGNIQDGKLDWSDLKYSSNADEIKKYKLRSGDVLFNRTNSPELVGKTALYRGERDAIYAGYLIRITVSEYLDAEYLTYCMNTKEAKSWCLEVKSDGVSQSNINAQKLAGFEIPVCAIEEQKEIVRRVESLFTVADRIECSYSALKDKIDRLPQAILSRAFRGEFATAEKKVAEYSEEIGRLGIAAEP